MVKQSKAVYVIGSIIIGIIAILGIIVGLIFGGVLDATSNKLVFASSSAEKVYDATALYSEEWEMVSGELREGHQAKVTVVGSQVVAGSSQNELSVVILDQNQADVTGDYEIEIMTGTLTVLQRRIDVVAHSDDKPYDGKPLTVHDYTLLSGTLVDGHSAKVEYVGEITDVGEVENKISLTVLNINGEDVSSNYDLRCLSGKLKITPREITIRSNDYFKEYFGQPLTGKEDGYEIIEGSLADPENESISIALGGSQLDVGESDNTFSATIYNGDEKDVTSNYNITYHYGKLTVGERLLAIESLGFSKEYDGTPLTYDEYKISQGSVADNQELTVNCTGTITEVGSVDNIFSYTIIDNEGNDVSYNYNVETIYGILTVGQKLVYIETFSDEKSYDGTPLFNEGWEFIEQTGVADGHEVVIVDVTEVTDVTEFPVKNQIQFKIIDKNDNDKDVTANYNITLKTGELQVTPITLKVFTGSRSETYTGQYYDKPEFWAEDPSLLLDGHYLIPTGEFSVKNAGEHENKIPLAVLYNDAQANVIDVTKNYNLVYEYGIIRIAKRHIILASASKTQTYNALDLTFGDYLVDGVLVNAGESYVIPLTGDTVTLTTKGVIRDVGVINNEIDLYNIVDSENVSTVANYEISIVCGTLTITPRKITIKTETKEFIYNGLPHSHEVVYVNDELVTGDKFDLTLSSTTFETFVFGDFASIVNAGVEMNSVLCQVLKFGGIESSLDNYEILQEFGNLIVKQKAITIVSGSDKKSFDGTPLTKTELDVDLSEGITYKDNGYYVTDTGEALLIDFTGTITNVGVQNNTYAVSVWKQSNEESTQNYIISQQCGVLQVDKRDVEICSGTATTTYNGEEQKYEECYVFDAIATSGLVSGHSIIESSVVFDGFTDVGIHTNTFKLTSIEITDGTTTVTDNYNLIASYGELIITQKRVVIETGGAAKPYDGTPLTCDEYFWHESVLDCHTVDVKVIGKQIPIGENENECIVTILDSNGNDVTHNYNVQKYLGTLTVYSTSSNGSQPNSNGQLSNDGKTPPTKEPLYLLTTSSSGYVYLKTKSYGDYYVSYDGTSGWATATTYTSSVNAQHFGFEALKKVGNTPSNITIEKLQQNLPYVVPYYTDLSQETNKNDCTINKDDTTYTLSVIPYSPLVGSFIVGVNLNSTTCQQAEYDYRTSFVYEYYLTLPDTTREVMEKVIEKYKLDKDSTSIINDVATLVQNYVDYSFEYHYEGDIAVYFFQQAETGICQHYATAATALYRALGIPARYTEGVAGPVEEGETIIYSPGHAWVEVYIDGFGWMPVEVTGSGGGMSDNDDSKDNDGIFVKPFDLYAHYTETNYLNYDLSENKDKLQGDQFERLVKQNGFTYTFKVDGFVNGVGKVKTKILDFHLFDSNGQEITDNYKFSFHEGVAQIYVQEITIQTTSQIKYLYDGTEHVVTPNGNYSIIKGELLNEHRITDVTFNVKRKNIGKTSIKIDDIVIKDNSGETVTDCYKINYELGKLVVESRPITIEALSGKITLAEIEKMGGTFTLNDVDDFEIIKGELVDGHTIEVELEGSISAVGRKDNKIKSVKILDELGADVTANYSITTVTGKLAVVPN